MRQNGQLAKGIVSAHLTCDTSITDGQLSKYLWASFCCQADHSELETVLYDKLNSLGTSENKTSPAASLVASVVRDDRDEARSGRVLRPVPLRRQRDGFGLRQRRGNRLRRRGEIDNPSTERTAFFRGLRPPHRPAALTRDLRDDERRIEAGRHQRELTRAPPWSMLGQPAWRRRAPTQSSRLATRWSPDLDEDGTAEGRSVGAPTQHDRRRRPKLEAHRAAGAGRSTV